MKERPILFSGPMVRAILDGSKTQTRRVIDPKQPKYAMQFKNEDCGNLTPTSKCRQYWGNLDFDVKCPHGGIGDRLWVRESLKYDDEIGHYYAALNPGSLGNNTGQVWLEEFAYEDLLPRLSEKNIPSIHMPRWASRITLEIKAIRVERLQDISEADALAEGCFKGKSDNYFHSTIHPVKGNYQCWISAKQAFEKLWESIIGSGSWDANPWVWVIEFEKLEVV